MIVSMYGMRLWARINGVPDNMPMSECRRFLLYRSATILALIAYLLRTALIAIAATIVLGSAPSHAQFASLCFVNDPLLGIMPCDSVGVQLLQYARQALQLEQETKTAIQEAVNTIALPGQIFQDATGEIQQIIGISKQADLLLGNTGQFIGNLNASSYPIGPLNNPMAEIVKEQNAIANAIRGLGQVIGVVNPQLASRATLLSAIQSESLGAAGRMQALQDANQLAATTGQDLHSLVALTVGMAQGQQATMLADQDRRAMQYKALDVMSTYTNDIPTGPGF
jgi:P-type conjugative transfer protein TrbJ